MDFKTKLIIPVVLMCASLSTAINAAEVIAFNAPVEFSTPKSGNLSVAKHRYVSQGNSPVFDDCVRKLKDFKKNAEAFYRIRIEYRTTTSDQQRILDRCTLDPR
jgi:hypothetical protein